MDVEPRNELTQSANSCDHPDDYPAKQQAKK
jgi:hypothetical protein